MQHKVKYGVGAQYSLMPTAVSLTSLARLGYLRFSRRILLSFGETNQPQHVFPPYFNPAQPALRRRSPQRLRHFQARPDRLLAGLPPSERCPWPGQRDRVHCKDDLLDVVDLVGRYR